MKRICLPIRICCTALSLALCFPSVAAQSDAASAEKPAVHHSQTVSIKLPDHIPAECVANAANRYDVPSTAILAVLKQESGGRVGITSKNTNGSVDLGPAQLNDRSWGKTMQTKFGISRHALVNNMCQALMAQAYALRSEWDGCRRDGKPSIWCAIGRYHSRTPKYQSIYIRNVWQKYQSMTTRGAF